MEARIQSERYNEMEVDHCDDGGAKITWTTGTEAHAKTPCLEGPMGNWFGPGQKDPTHRAQTVGVTIRNATSTASRM